MEKIQDKFNYSKRVSTIQRIYSAKELCYAQSFSFFLLLINEGRFS